MINASAEDMTFVIEEDDEWRLAVDTSLVSPEDIAEAGAERAIQSRAYVARPSSIVVLIGSPVALDKGRHRERS
jgi:hypothetical protein